MKLELYLDYGCPFCLKGYHEVIALIVEEFCDLELKIVPCEAHPRPETHGLHTDICARGFYVAGDYGCDPIEYSDIIFKASLKDKVDIENVDVVADALANIIEPDDFIEGIEKGDYVDRLKENNEKAWETLGFPAVPSLKMGASTLPAVPGVGLTRGQIKKFIKANKA